MNLLSRRSFLLGGTLGFVSYLAYEVNAVRIVSYTVPIQNLPQPFHGFTILHLSDLHQKVFGKDQSRILALINRQRFDMVAVTGDILDQFRPDVGPSLALLHGLPTKPTFFVNGNNEWGAVYRHRYWIMRRLGDAGVAILNNSAVPLPRDGRHIWIAGVDDPSSGKDDVAKALSGTTDGAPTVLLAHSPAVFPEAIEHGVSLLLVGHTHGGQVRIPFVGAFWAPDLGRFPQWDYGEYRNDATTMIVNGGLGESILPIRVNIPPEIVLVTLVAGAR